ncbi:hypothetical protein [Streptomyces cinereoruber]|uniref:hypothetical protein n=1 Tax=Streptomyces cinereoruber TaxID=67260 RepID=UPI003636C003
MILALADRYFGAVLPGEDMSVGRGRSRYAGRVSYWMAAGGDWCAMAASNDRQERIEGRQDGLLTRSGQGVCTKL